jgi:murein L,D-transpeptidase YcbB/YkuD
LYLVRIECTSKYFKKRNFAGYCQNSNYLAKHDMEWLETVCDNGQAQNALGQVKFVFQTHIIYMHDTHQNSI